MWYPQRQVTTLFALGEKPLALLRREGKIAPREVRSWVRNQDLRIQRPLTWALRWISRTMWCFGHSRAAQPTNETRRFSEKNRPPFLVNNPWQGHFPMRTPACISGNSNTEIKCRVTRNINFLSKCNEKTSPLTNIHNITRYDGWVATGKNTLLKRRNSCFNRPPSLPKLSSELVTH